MVEDEAMVVEDSNLEKEARLERMEIRKKQFLSRNMAWGMLTEIIERVINYRNQELATNMLNNIVNNVMEEVNINRMVKELEAGGPKMKEKMEGKLRKIRIEEMQAMEMLLKEDQKIKK